MDGLFGSSKWKSFIYRGAIKVLDSDVTRNAILATLEGIRFHVKKGADHVLAHRTDIEGRLEEMRLLIHQLHEKEDWEIMAARKKGESDIRRRSIGLLHKYKRQRAKIQAILNGSADKPPNP